jgi:hypothetical protein
VSTQEFPAGPQVTGADFIGREGELRRLELLLSSPNNFSLTGLPRIGKSSLIRTAVTRLETSGVDPSLRFVQLALVKAQRAEDFFAALSREVRRLTEDGNEAIQFHIDRVEHAMKALAKQGLRVRLVLDEFDYAPSIFGASISYVREQLLCSYHFNNLTLATVSQASLDQLYEFEVGSDFPGLFGNNRMALTGFSDPDVALFRAVLESRCAPVGDDVWKLIRSQAGSHPFLLACWANSAICIAETRELDESCLLRLLEADIHHHEGALKYQLRALRRLGLREELKRFRQSEPIASRPEVGLRGLRLYGLVDEDGHLTIPALGSAWADRELDVAEAEEFELVRMLAVGTLDLADRKQKEAGWTLQSNTLRQLRKHNSELRSVKTVCEALEEVVRLDSTLLEPTTELLAAMQSRVTEATQFVERL